LANADIHVMAGVLLDETGQVLIAQRPTGKSMAGSWELPGGKLVPGEARFDGLARELGEELGISVDAARPLIRYRYRYADFSVDMDAWQVTHWQGTPEGREGQALAWHPPDALLGIGLLPADAVVVQAIRLPSLIAITPPHVPLGEAVFLDALESVEAPLVCLRRPDLDAGGLLELAAGAACRIEGSGRRLLLHGDPASLAPLILDPPSALRPRLAGAIAGVHVPAHFLLGLAARPVPGPYWFGTSCHDALELDAALALGADNAFLGPVKTTASHPGEPGMGWEKFADLVRELPLPVYAIGGLGPEDLETAWAAGAQGIAAIRGLWPG
jgi:8-oxo-dGTP diphosphatase